jgi:hypothetical protein
MSSVKQVSLTVLLLLAAALFAGTLAHGAGKLKSTWSPLTPTDAASGASGEARKVGGLVLVDQAFFEPGGWWWWIYSGTVEVKCSGLTRSTTYTVYWESGFETRAGEFPLTTDSFGAGAAVGGVNVCALSNKKPGGAVNISVLDANRTIVLSGTVPF